MKTKQTTDQRCEELSKSAFWWASNMPNAKELPNMALNFQRWTQNAADMIIAAREQTK